MVGVQNLLSNRLTDRNETHLKLNLHKLLNQSTENLDFRTDIVKALLALGLKTFA